MNLLEGRTRIWCPLLMQLLVPGIAVLSACSSADVSNQRSAHPDIAAAHSESKRTVSVYLVAERNTGFVPTYTDRVLTAEPVKSVQVARAYATTSTQGIRTVILGASCEELSASHKDIIDCSESIEQALRFGAVETTATTDSEGFATFQLGVGQYRISLQSSVTLEDNKCFWSGAEMLMDSANTLELPILVFCE